MKLHECDPTCTPRQQTLDQASVVQKLDSAIHWINLHPVDNAINFSNTYLLNSDL